LKFKKKRQPSKSINIRSANVDTMKTKISANRIENKMNLAVSNIPDPELETELLTELSELNDSDFDKRLCAPLDSQIDTLSFDF